MWKPCFPCLRDLFKKVYVCLKAHSDTDCALGSNWSLLHHSASKTFICTIFNICHPLSSRPLSHLSDTSQTNYYTTRKSTENIKYNAIWSLPTHPSLSGNLKRIQEHGQPGNITVKRQCMAAWQSPTSKYVCSLHIQREGWVSSWQ